MKKWLLVFSVALLLLVGGFFLVRYIQYEQDPNPHKTFLVPRVELVTMEITHLSREKVNIHSRILVRNHVPAGLTIDSMRFAFFMNGEKIGESHRGSRIDLKGNDSSRAEFLFSIFGEKFEQVTQQHEQRGEDSAIYSLKGTLYSGLFIGDKLDIDLSRKLPLIFIPEAELKKVELDSLQLSGAYMRLTAVLRNKNDFPILASGISYRMLIAGSDWSAGKKEDTLVLPARGSSEEIFPVFISFEKAGEKVAGIIKKGRNISYELEMTMQMISEKKFLSASKVIIFSKGTIRELTDLRKSARKNKKVKKVKEEK